MTCLQYPDYLAILDLEDTLQCPVCFELRDGHVFVCQNGHHVCGQCKNLLAECPVCRSRILNVRNLVVETLTSNYGFLQGMLKSDESTAEEKRAFDFTTSDFSTIVKTAAFVDKTLMLKVIFNSSSQMLITAPPRSGKSTNVDMVKRFLEITVDSSGAPEPVHTTENYRLFKDNNLNICCHDEFFNEHFGNYPVISMDWKALGRASDFTNMIAIFRTIIIETFSLHSYLLQLDNFWTDDLDVNKFKQYLSEQLIKDLDEQDLTWSFKFLSRVLYRQFSKRVFILIDNCDTFVNSILFKNNPGSEKIISFVCTTLDNLLDNNHCVGRALLTGVLPLIGKGFPFRAVDCYSFLHDHDFCRFYGFTSEELHKVVDKLEKDGQKRNEIRNTIEGRYKCYVSENRNVHVCSMWSVLQYLRKRKVHSCWCSHECVSGLKSAFQNHTIRNKVVALLSGEDLQLDASHPLSTGDILQLNNVAADSKIENASVVDTVFLLLYHLGYFSISGASRGGGCVSLKIPNVEIKCELAKIFLETNYDQEYVDNTKHILSAIESFGLHSVNRKNIFETLDATLQVWSRSAFTKWDTPQFYLIHLFIALISLPECQHTEYYRLGSDGPSVILSKNKHRVGVCITAQEDTSADSTAETREETAINAHKLITARNYEEQTFGKFSDLCGKVLIAVGYKSEPFDGGFGFYVSIAYSHQFTPGGSLQNYTTL